MQAYDKNAVYNINISIIIVRQQQSPNKHSKTSFTKNFVTFVIRGSEDLYKIQNSAMSNDEMSSLFLVHADFIRF